MKIAAAGAILVLMIISGCGTSTAVIEQTVTALSEPLETSAVIDGELPVLPVDVPWAAIPGEVEESVPGGEIDWSGNTVRATGTGVVDGSNPNAAQARLMAERAAVVVAQRNLLELVEGVRVDSETRVENFMTDYDVISTRVEGMVRGARQLGPARFDSVSGTVEVELEMEIYSPQGLSGALSPILGGGDAAMASLTPQVQDFLRQYSGLIFDGSRAGLQPSMYPKIYDEEGRLLLDTSQYAGYLGAGGQTAMQFISDLDRVLSLPEFSQSPLVLDILQVTGQLGTDIIISSQDAEKVGWLSEGFDFLLGAGRLLLRVLL